jgi:hypothetical protein
MSNHFITEDELKAINVADKGTISKSVGQMSEDECKKIIEQTKIKYGFETSTQTLIAISGLCQLGGTNRGSGRSISYNYKGKSLIVGEFSNICQSIKAGGTARQFARALGTTIAPAEQLQSIYMSLETYRDK